MTLFLLMIFFILVFIGAPVFIALSFSAFSALLFFTDLPLMVVTQRMLGGIDKFSLMSVPFFILGANVMKKGGIADRILKWSQVMVGSTRGGLAFTTIIACMFFGAVSGSSPATVIAIGGLMYPALKKNQYDGGFSVGLIASSGSIALLIPPSISAIIYGAVTGVSVGALFMAGAGAGIIYSIAYLIYSYWFAVRKNIEPGPKSTYMEKLKATLSASWALGIPMIIMGGIYLGVFTPTEASGVSAIYAIIISMFIYKEMSLKELIKTCVDSAQSTAQLMLLLASASIFGWVLTVAQVPQDLANLIIGGNFGPYSFLMLVNVMLLIAGMFIDGSSAIIITAPLLYPIAMRLGINPIHLGVIMVTNAAIGMFTPPFGLNLFVAQPATGEKMINIIKGVIPFVIISIIALIFITYFPQISLFLPRLIYGTV
ncbi:TRAP transporter large permease [Alkaliphilus serpentinus]|uniref:TRAP transporter large permease subunit n=1 Tax=Alkaliphilus serpentinus TaxID=1482731 RepID=A0A833HNM8_9FIRM|nr:TRAP transporter large permease subunit [Alkaliphilus serpentinus]KAB3529694.1 TRAP transporter large permease subunit [Alkaliphilus serpentinus]